MPLRTRLPQPVVNRTVSLPTAAASTVPSAKNIAATPTALTTSVREEVRKNGGSGSRLALRRRASKRSRASALLTNMPSASADFYLASKSSSYSLQYEDDEHLVNNNNADEDDDDDEEDDDDDDDDDAGDVFYNGIAVDEDNRNGENNNNKDGGSSVDLLPTELKPSLKGRMRAKSKPKIKTREKVREKDKSKGRDKTKVVVREQEKGTTKLKGRKSKAKLRRLLPFPSQAVRDTDQDDHDDSENSLQLHISAFTPLSRRARHEPQLIAVLIRPASPPTSSNASSPASHSNNNCSSVPTKPSTMTTTTMNNACVARPHADPAAMDNRQQNLTEGDGDRAMVGSWDVWRHVAVVTALPAVVNVPLDGLPLNSVILRLSFYTLKPSRHVGNATTPLSRLLFTSQSLSKLSQDHLNAHANRSRGAIVLPVTSRDNNGPNTPHASTNHANHNNPSLHASAVVFVRAAYTNPLCESPPSPLSKCATTTAMVTSVPTSVPTSTSTSSSTSTTASDVHTSSPAYEASAEKLSTNLMTKFPPGLTLSVRTAPSMRRDTRHTAAVALSVIIDSKPPLPAGRVALPRRGSSEPAARIAAPPNVLWFGLQQLVQNAYCTATNTTTTTTKNNSNTNNNKGPNVFVRIEWLGSAKRGVALVHGRVDIPFDKLAQMRNGHLLAVHWAYVAGAIPMSPSVVVDSIALRDGSWFLELSLTR